MAAMSLLTEKIKTSLRNFVRKVKQILSNKYVQIVLLSGSIVIVAFIGGKYYERRNTSTLINLPAHPALPIYGTVSAQGNTEPRLTEVSCLSSLFDFGKWFSKDPTSVKATSPDPSKSPFPEFDEMIDRNSKRIGQIMKYGYPGTDNIIPYTNYVLSYDKRNRVANWAFEHLTAASVKYNLRVERATCYFDETENIHPYFRATNKDYKGSGYDRGHLAAAGNHKSCQQLVDETFQLANITPQVGEGFNRGCWNRLERYVRGLTKKYPNVYCCTGPLYLPIKEPDGKTYIKYQVIGANHVAVPTHFFKVVVGEHKDGKLDMECYVMENVKTDDQISLKSFRVPPVLVERASGLLFFDRASKPNILTINGTKEDSI